MGILSDDNIFGSDVIRKERQSKTHAKNKRKDALGSNKRPRNAQTKNRSMDDSDTEFEPHALPSDNQSSSFRPKETLKLMKMARTAKDEALNEEEENSEDSSAEIEDTENSSEELEYETNSETMTEVDELEQQAYDLDDADRKAFMNFQPPTQEYRGTLADIILAKLKENKERKKANLKDKSDTHSVHAAVDPKVARVYRAVGKVLQNYTHGKLPKAFKMMPRLTNWEELLWLTKPQEWSPSALYVATRLFASNLNEAMAQRFYYIFLLSSIGAAFETPKSECKVALHPQRYNAIRKAMFKPMAFVRGFLIPLFEEIEPSVQLTTIIASVLKKGSLQPVAAALAVVKIAGMSYTPARALILRVIIEKKTKLPEQAKDAMLSYFFSFLKKPSDTETVASQSVEKVTVIWHQLLLAYVSCYQIHADHLALFRDLCHKHFHPVLTPEVLRILSGNK